MNVFWELLLILKKFYAYNVCAFVQFPVLNFTLVTRDGPSCSFKVTGYWPALI